MFMRPQIHALSERNPQQDPANSGAVPPDNGNSGATIAEHKYNQGLWKILKNQCGSVISIACALSVALS